MAKMGKYCKAYPIARLREFEGWPDAAQGRQEEGMDTENDFLYLQENFTVTKGIFMDEDIVFDNVTPEWIDFCKNNLKFDADSREAASAASVANPE